jgi:protein SCO1/2
MISCRSGSLLLALLLGTPWMAIAQTALERPFTLVDTNGRMISDKDLRGRWLLVFFGYMSCPDICPTTLSLMAAVLEQLGPLATRVQPMFITVDPTRDTPEALHAYLAPFDQGIIGLTGNDEQIARTAAIFGARYFKVSEGDPQEYTIAHSTLIYVIGPEGGIVTQFSNATDPDGMAKTLATLMK